jgi:hypothetical protein
MYSVLIDDGHVNLLDKIPSNKTDKMVTITKHIGR